MTPLLLADGALPPRHGATGPPRDLAFRRSPTNGHGTTGPATVATTNQGGITAGMPAMSITQNMSQQDVGPSLVVHFQAWDGSAPQYQGTQMQIPRTTRHSIGIPTPGICQDCRIYNPGTRTSSSNTGPSSTWYRGAAGSRFTGSSRRGTDTPVALDTRDMKGPMAGTMAMMTAGGGGQATIGQAGQPGSGGAGVGGHGTLVGARPPRAGYSGIGTYLDKLGPSILDPETVLSVLQW
jgi:hypothetical protein